MIVKFQRASFAAKFNSLKMTKSILILIVNLILSFLHQPLLAVKKEYDPQKKYAPAQLKEDLKFTMDKLVEYHPGIYWYISKENLHAHYDSLYNSITAPMNEVEFFNVVQSLFQKVSEGHNRVFLSDDGWDWLKKRPTFPFELKLMDNRLFIAKNGSSDTTLNRGTEILSINQRTSFDIIKEMRKRSVSDGNNITGINQRELGNWFWFNYFLLMDTSSSFNLEVKRWRSDAIEKVKINGATREEFTKRVERRHPTNDKYIREFYIVDSSRTAVFRMDSFINNKKDNSEEIGGIQAYMDYVFNEIEKNGEVDHLIIDLRKNGGGTPGSEISILSYLGAASEKVYKPLERNKRALFYKKGDDGRFYSEKVLGYSLEPKENMFKGQVYVLTSGKTYSAASLLAISLDQFTNAIIIGEETGGGFYGTTGGSWARPNTPNVKLDLRIPKIRFKTNAKGQSLGTGLLPDYEVKPTLHDFVKERDTELNYVFGLIEHKNREVKALAN